MNEKPLLINCDTTIIKKNSKDIIQLSNNFNSIIENIFINIKNIDKEDQNWNGHSPNEFINNCFQDKEFFINLYIKLKEYGNNYLSLAQSLEDNIKGIDKIE